MLEFRFKCIKRDLFLYVLMSDFQAFICCHIFWTLSEQVVKNFSATINMQFIFPGMVQSDDMMLLLCLCIIYDFRILLQSVYDLLFFSLFNFSSVMV